MNGLPLLEIAGAAALGAVIGWGGHAAWARRSRRAAAASSAAPPGPGAPPRQRSEGASLAGRVIVHLVALGRIGPNEVASDGFTQKGIAKALDLRQGTVAKVLSRLELAGVVEVDRRHVSGAPRRLKVYRLTPLGESIARDLRRRRSTAVVVPTDRVGRTPPRIEVARLDR